MSRFHPALWMLLPLLGSCSQPASAPEGQKERGQDSIRLEPGNPRLEFVKIETVQPSDAANLVSLTGKVTVDEDHTQRMASPIDGRVTALLVRVGDKVKAGQGLVELSSPSVGQVMADAQKALQDMGVAQKALDRAHKLHGDGAISEKELAQVEADFKKVKSDVARTGAQLHSLGVSLSDPTPNAQLRAQITGVVIERNVLVGQEVRADAPQPLLTISSLDTVWVVADVYEQDLGLIEDHAAVSVRVPAYPDDVFPGEVTHIGEVVDPQSRTVKIRCMAANPGHRLKPEMFAKVDLQNKTGKKVIVVPSKAVLNEADGARVIVVTDDHVFHLRKVAVGPQVGHQVRVLSGLSPGEHIVTEGALFLKKDIESE